jgi:hypothetical protein
VRVYSLSTAWQCQFLVTIRASLSIARASTVVLVGTPSWPSCVRQKAATRTHQQYYANLLTARGHCFTALTFSFAMRVSEQVTPIFVLPVEMPTPCHVRLGRPTLKPCESFAVYRTQLSLPYVLRSTHCFRQHDKGTPDAKLALGRVNHGRTEFKAVAVNALRTIQGRHRARQAFHFWRTRLPSSFARSCRRK